MEADDLTTFNEDVDKLTTVEDTEYHPLYKMVSDNKIAISKKEGVLWAQRLALAKKRMEKCKTEWDVNLDTYLSKNKPNSDYEKKELTLREKDYNYENLVWSNTMALNRETIMKLPHIEITANSEEHEPYVNPLEHALNNYLGSVGNNGINMKEKLKKSDIAAQLTNRGIIRLDWNEIIDGDAVKQQISAIESKLAEPNLSLEKVKKYEGELFALNEKLEESGMSGLQFTLVDPRNLFIDPNSQLETGLDADWMIERRVELKTVIEAKYGSSDGTVYAGDKSDIDSDEATKLQNNKYIFGDDTDTDMQPTEALQTTTVYYIWDKLKKRVYLYEEGKWDYPLWVWDDPYGLMRFFPYFILSYNLAPFDNESYSECSYYLPIQNQINDINSKMKQARDRAFNITLYDGRSNLEPKDLQNLTNGKSGYVKINIPEGRKITDMVMSMPTPGLEQPLMNKGDLYAVMQKLTSSDPTMRGEEYKTNTTNMAVQQYTTAKKVVIGVRIDQIISFYLSIAKEVLKLMLDRFAVTDWTKVCSDQEAEFITSNPITFRELDFTFAGDDTVEPTSAMKKQEAVQLGQIMGQFAGATPAITIVMLKLMSRAFNEIVITPQDWEMIFSSIQQQMQQPAPQPQGPMPPEQPMPPPAEQQPPQEEMINQAAMM